MYNILIADDLYSIRVGVKTIITEVLGPQHQVVLAPDYDALKQAVHNGRFDLVVIDLHLQGINGMSLIKTIIDHQADPKIVVMTKLGNDCFFETCMGLGEVKAFISKHTSEAEIRAAFENAVQGRRFVPEMQQQQLEQWYLYKKDFQNPFDVLSAREQKVTQLLLKGLGILEIGNELAISSSTASTYKSRIFKKLNVSNVIELNKHADQFGFITNGFEAN